VVKNGRIVEEIKVLTELLEGVYWRDLEKGSIAPGGVEQIYRSARRGRCLVPLFFERTVAIVSLLVGVHVDESL
jgi:hypothetical protein